MQRKRGTKNIRWNGQSIYARRRMKNIHRRFAQAISDHD